MSGTLWGSPQPPTPTGASVGVYRMPVRVGWGHCDPAGIVYFPRFFELFHEAMERWFEEPLQLPYTELIVGRRIGFPSVHTEADFKAPSAFGDALVVELRVGGVGSKSIVFDYRVVSADGGEEPRVVGRTVCAVMNLDESSDRFRRAIPVPDDLRDRIDAFMKG